ncbi:MAG TPA: hypothetical protein VII69_02095 [Candidatus Eremiobacteraceae bacterium]
MEPITTYRQTDVDVPWNACVRILTEILTAEEWSGERARLVGRTNLHFAVAVRHIEAAFESVRFRLIADSPDLHHPISGFVELRRKSRTSTALTVTIAANLAEEARRYHLGMREAIASLADVLTTTIATAVNV